MIKSFFNSKYFLYTIKYSFQEEKRYFDILVIEELISFLKKKGFRDTFQVLTQFNNNKTDKHTFYNELNKFSYYNSFFRVKEELISKGLIEIEVNQNRKKFIKLTQKGLDVFNRLVEINELINNHGAKKKKG